jgi:hypothetical protein
MPLKSALASSTLIDNPYSPPAQTDSSTPPQHECSGRTFTRPTLFVFCFGIAAITWTSISNGVPAMYSPFPLLVIFPALLGFPVPLIAAGTGVLFALTQIAHFKGAPKPNPNLGFTIALALTTALTTLAIIAGWSYGLRYQGLAYCVVVTIANILFACASWTLWWAARTPARYRVQVLFAFTLFAWIFWYALPYMGEV